MANMSAIEKAAMKEMKDREKPPEQKTREDFNIIKGRPLPEGFENPPIGDPEHLCLDNGGLYDPTWVQVNILAAYDKQVNPQDFPLAGVTYQVSLDTWTDVPPGVLESLKSAVEVHHDYETKPGMIALGEHPQHRRISRQRFQYHWLPSA